MSRARLTVWLVASACGSDEAVAPLPPPPMVPADAPIDGITTIGGFDPSSGMHLDDDTPDRPRGKRQTPQGPAIGILLKSDPPGATVFVDGQNYGVTPKYWNGVADGSEHEFAFTLAKYGLARYRFVPIASGTLHATLERVSGGETLDAGIQPAIAPKLAPDAAIKPDAAIVAPPPTVLAPADAAVPTAPATTIDAAPRPQPGPQP